MPIFIKKSCCKEEYFAALLIVNQIKIVTMALNEQPEDSDRWKITVHVEITEEEDDLDPPDPDLESAFNDIDEWLVDMCKNDLPQNEIAKFNFGVFESVDHYTLYLTGVNSYKEGNHTKTTIEFLPTHCYFRIPTAFHEHQGREETIKNIKTDLDNFAQSECFQNSFFRSAEIVQFETTGEVIWSKSL